MTHIICITHIIYRIYIIYTSHIILKLIKNAFYKNVFVYIKMVNKYHQKHKERLPKEAHERYENLSEEEKDKRRKKVRERHQNFTEGEK